MHISRHMFNIKESDRSPLALRAVGAVSAIHGYKGALVATGELSQPFVATGAPLWLQLELVFTVKIIRNLSEIIKFFKM